MSRLYYDKKTDPQTQKGVAPPTNTSNGKEYLEKVAKIVPSEIIAGYLALVGLVPSIGLGESVEKGFYYGIFILCVILTPIYFKAQSDKTKPTPTIHIILSTVAFVIWAYSTTGDKIVHDFFNAAIASIVLAAFSLITGKIPLN